MTTAAQLAMTSDLDLDAIAAKASNLLGGSVYLDNDGDPVGVIYYADETSTWYAVSLDDCAGLVELDRNGTKDAYSHWCAGSTPDGEGATEDEALAATDWDVA